MFSVLGECYRIAETSILGDDKVVGSAFNLLPIRCSVELITICRRISGAGGEETINQGRWIQESRPDNQFVANGISLITRMDEVEGASILSNFIRNLLAKR